ncbi:MAG: sulfotransferase domain-containing protein, partial [Bacteroidota bacterium]
MQPKCANLILAGVSKCGSTSLFSYLAAHPDVCGSNVKETQFFMPLKFGKPLPLLNEYEKFFTNCVDEKYRLDATPYYLFGGKKIATAIRENLGEVKIIFILRNPVGRCYSWYQHALYHLMIPNGISFSDYLKVAEEKI